MVATCKAAHIQPTNVDQHRLLCVQKVGQHFMLANNVGHLRTCSFFVGQQVANRALWLAAINNGDRMDGCILCWPHYTSPFHLKCCIIHECIQIDFGCLRFRLRAIKQITAAAMSSSPPYLAVVQQNVVCVWNDANTCWPTFGMLELTFQRTFAPGNESSIKVPWNFRSLELSFPGTFAPWNFRSLPRTVALRVNFLIGLTIVNIIVRCRREVFLITTVNKWIWMFVAVGNMQLIE